MQIAVAPNAFRESMSAVQAVHAIAEGLSASRLDCTLLLMPLADGATARSKCGKMLPMPN